MPFRKANFILRKNNIAYKIFKIVLDKNGDLYFIFNYCKTKEYKSGNAVIKAQQSDLIFTPTIEGKISQIPVKLSYHKDGQMHFKPLESSLSDLPKSYKLAQIKTSPFNNLKDDHFLTIELEVLDKFEVVKIKKANEYNRIFDVPKKSVRYKFIFSGCSNPNDTVSKYYPVDILSIGTTGDPYNFNIAIQCQIFNDSIKVNTSEDKLLFIVICGFKSDDNVPERDLEFIYLQAE